MPNTTSTPHRYFVSFTHPVPTGHAFGNADINTPAAISHLDQVNYVRAQIARKLGIRNADTIVVLSFSRYADAPTPRRANP